MFKIAPMYNRPISGLKLSHSAALFWLVGLFIPLLLLGIGLGILNISVLVTCVGALALLLLIAIRQDEFVVGIVLIVHIYVDWFLSQFVVVPIITIILLSVFYLRRSAKQPWHMPRALWLWGFYLLFAIYPTVQGTVNRYDLAFYYLNIILGALLMYWLGSIIARDGAALRRFFQTLAMMSTLLAIVTIFQSETGILPFASSHYASYLASVSNFQLGTNSNVHRVGSFLLNPDWNGAFFAVTSLVPLGLFVETPSIMKKVVYVIEILLLLSALLMTYSLGAWISTITGAVVFVLLLQQGSHRIWFIICLIVIPLSLLILFPAQITLLFQRLSDPQILLLRNGAWQTAINIIKANPLTGIGLGQEAYLQHSQPYLAPTQFILLAHPHNSYLELGAMGGIPLLATFIALLAISLYQSWRNWLRADRRLRALIGVGIAVAVALSVNSFSVNAWTLPPLAAIGWLVIGMTSSRDYTTLREI